MVAEACQDTGHVYTSYSGYGDITIQSNDCDSPIATLITITDPWSNNHTNQIMSIGTIKTFTSGSEAYTVEMTDMFCGVETTWSDYTECWYTDDGNRYVKPSGSNSDIGNNWANAWQTAGYGFQNIPSEKDLYVEEGYYGGETLSNLNPPQTMSMYIQPGSHTEAPTTVMVSGDALATNFTSARNDSINWANLTYLQRSSSIAANGTIYSFEFKAGAVGFNGSLKFKILRLVGSNYEYIGGTDAFSHTLAAGEIVSNVIVDGIDVQSGDLIAMFVAGATKVTYATSGGASMLVYGVFGYDVVGTTPTSAWGDTALSYSIGVKTYGV